MRRALITAATAVTLLALPPLGGAPASAAIARVRVIDCRGSEPMCWPAAFAFTPNGREVFYVERFTGQIRRHTLATNHDIRWAKINNVATSGEQGLLGLDLDPRWNRAPKFRWVYLYYTHRNPLQNRIIRLRKTGNGLVRNHLQTIPAASGYHNGGPIHFGPDGMLWAATGDAHSAGRAQDRDDPGGKVLRLTPTGRRPGNNPIPGSKAYSFGHRNSFGFAFDPLTGRPWQTENGPECNDEINLIVRGGNYAWGPNGTSCPPGTNQSGPQPRRLPERMYTPVIAPTGAAFCDGCGLGQAAENDLLFGAWRDGIIRRLVLNGNRNGVTGQQQVFNNPSGVMAVEAAPGGRIHFSDPSGIFVLRRT
jgi:glucose/arabinose dehydrogenase